MITLDEMQAHVDSLIAQYGICTHWEEHPWVGWAAISWTTPQKIWIPRIKSEGDYLICLHEIAHCVMRHPDQETVRRESSIPFREAQAWAWVFEHSLIEPDANTIREHAWGATPTSAFRSYYESYCERSSSEHHRKFTDAVAAFLRGDAPELPGMVTA